MAKIEKPMKASNARVKRLASIESLIQPVASIKRPVYMLAWGRVKSGKTRLIASGPNPIIFACEEGTRTVQDYPDVTVFPVNDQGLWVPPKWKHARDFIYYLHHADHDFQTVGVDTSTALLRVAVRYINKDEEIRDDMRAKGTTDRRTWGRVGSLLNEFMEDLEQVCKAKSMNLIYTAQERSLDEEKAEQEGSRYVPDLTPAVRSTILEKPDILARTVIEEDDSGEDMESTDLKYGMIFKHSEWPVGVREPRGRRPFPNKSYNVTIPKLEKRLNATKEVKSG